MVIMKLKTKIKRRNQQRRNEKQSIKRCIILSGLVNDILTKEKELQEMIEAKLNLADKRLKELG